MESQPHVRREEPGDAAEIERIHTQAFGRSTEARIVRALRHDVRPLISLVAQSAATLVGHVVFSPVTVEGASRRLALGLGPMAVLPSVQRHGIGSHLVREGLRECAAQGVAVVFVLGHPDYYPRFGFQPAAPLGLHYRSAALDSAFFVLELEANGLAGLQGCVRYHRAFDAREGALT